MVNWTSTTTTATVNTVVTDGDKLAAATSAINNNNPSIAQSITAKYPSYYRNPLRTNNQWLRGKRRDDDAEGLWRINDSLYDLTKFMDSHPGGAEWIRSTKGTDITEAFEVHHIGTRPEQLLPKFRIRTAQSPRNVQLTFHEHGFYKTLKRRVRDKLTVIDYRPARTSEMILDSLLCSSFVLASMAINFDSYLLAAICALFISWTMIAAHNFFHRKDNWRMLAFNLAFFSYRDWRISHVLSHHLFPNSLLDLEISLVEPFICFLPIPSSKNLLQRFGSWIYGPVYYCAMFFGVFVIRIIESVISRKNTFYADNIIPAALPLFMLATSNSGIWEVLKMWFFIVLVASFVFAAIGVTAAHHHPDVVHSGDWIPTDIDFGVYQMAAIIDRSDINGSQFKALVSFGDHSLHHLFPTLDHGILPQLYPVFLKTCAEFQLEYRAQSLWPAVVGQHQQLARIEPMVYVPTKKFNQ
ncbi:cytochrome b5-related protein-like [Ochlerotatus camptorhynchus]|uniref:cytochrome b5-related protein-like n=1 Tax=Ochlerotatus camptorhynchus TaxID=644619 RepID=UPI0031D60D4A